MRQLSDALYVRVRVRVLSAGVCDSADRPVVATPRLRAFIELAYALMKLVVAERRHRSLRDSSVPQCDRLLHSSQMRLSDRSASRAFSSALPSGLLAIRAHAKGVSNYLAAHTNVFASWRVRGCRRRAQRPDFRRARRGDAALWVHALSYRVHDAHYALRN